MGLSRKHEHKTRHGNGKLTYRDLALVANLCNLGHLLGRLWIYNCNRKHIYVDRRPLRVAVAV